jgi:hypothetical protein
MRFEDRQIISPRTFALGGFLIIAMLAYASCSFGAELSPEQRVERAKPALRIAIESVGYVCDHVETVSYNDAVPGVVKWWVMCDGFTRTYTVLADHKRFIVYPGQL